MSNLLDRIDEIANQLERNASIKNAKEMERVQAYYEGYRQACEDFCRGMRSEVISQSKRDNQGAAV